MKQDTAILVGINTIDHIQYTEQSLLELEHLALALNIKTKDRLIQNMTNIHPKYYIGSGKVHELKKMVDILDVDMVIFDDPLTPSQLLHLEAILNVQIFDRSFIILSIFAERAASKQAILEVKLAQKLYMLPRLSSLSKSLSRQGGGSYNAKGPGETKLEMDRRKLSDEISFLKNSLKKIAKEKELNRKKRLKEAIPVVALVGYTNAGKSSLMNSLTEYLESDNELVLEKDMLFATLDTKTKRLRKEGKIPFLLIDTVGFINKLPHELINSFQATLQDVLTADLIIHVVDGAHYDPLHVEITNQVLNHLGAKDIERILVLTKCELRITRPYIEDDYIPVSNKTKENIDALVNSIYAHIDQGNDLVTFHIPYQDSGIIKDIKNTCHIIKTYQDEVGIKIYASCPRRLVQKYQKYLSL